MEERIVKPPFFKILFPYFIGLIGGTFLPIPLRLIAGGIVLVVLLIVYSTVVRPFSYYLRLLPFSLFFLAWGAYQMRSFELSSQWNFPADETVYRGTVISQGVDRPKTVRYYVEIDHFGSDHRPIFDKEWGIVLYIPRSKTAIKFQKGDRISFRTTLRHFENQPDRSFDIRAYYRYQQLFAYGFASDVILIRSYQPTPIEHLIGQVRGYMVNFITTVLDQQSHRSILSALLLGDKSAMPTDLRDSFARTGTLHLLVVSGVHCAFLYGLFSFLLGFLPRTKRWGKWIRQIILLFLVWFYVLLTGGSVPVVRAAVMLSIVIVGRLLSRSADSFNSLYLAAFLILFFAPYQWMTVGFQLSFLALFSILYGNIYWEQWWWCERQNRVVRYGLSLLFVSFSAQMGVMPLLLYYFGYISSWFLFSNLVAVPIVSMVLYLSVGAMMLLHFAPFLTSFVSLALSFLLNVLLQTVAFVSHLPMATFYHQRIPLGSAVLLWCLIHLLPLIWRRRYSFIWIVIYFLFLLLFFLF